MINLTINELQLKKNIEYCRERGIILPTFEQMKDPSKIPGKIKSELKNIGLWEIHPRNLFRITWKNEQIEKGGGFKDTNYLVLPPALTGCKANIVAIVGKFFPTGAHKVGATFGCLAPRLVTGQYDPVGSHAVWPSTGNFCRGGAFVSALLGLKSIAILPEEMSQERFSWLSKVAGEIIATPGCESNVKEIFDKCWELKTTRKDVHIFNQFEELGNPLWHYHVTGSAINDALKQVMKPNNNFAGAVYSSGSGGTLGSGYYLKSVYPNTKIAAVEALQCPTLLNNGYGGHRIEGIGDKHVPWIHDMKNTDMVIAVDDEHTMRLLRLFNDKKGKEALKKQGVSEELLDQLDLIGISGIGNLIAAIKFAKYYELTSNDFVATVFTDSMELYGSRLGELTDELGAYSNITAARDTELIDQITTDHMLELNYYDRKRVHNLKYFTWIEQQNKNLEELNAQWFDHKNYWQQTFGSVSAIDELIRDFNQKVEI
ncbi:MAG: pyridoxal-phosphate dependent enzyme [Bacteriovoracaceae bacterium]|nr:pyridoxal-phosphate dependent enzyme [Bacteriovoracaceae bacterium]